MTLDTESGVMYRGDEDGFGVPLAVERNGRTDCGECVFRSADCMSLPQKWDFCLETESFIIGRGPEFCGEFVEAVL